MHSALSGSLPRVQLLEVFRRQFHEEPATADDPPQIATDTARQTSSVEVNLTKWVAAVRAVLIAAHDGYSPTQLRSEQISGAVLPARRGSGISDTF